MGESPAEDMKNIAVALEHATKNGLQVEFVLWFGYEMSRNSDVQTAIQDALYEWDL